MAKKISELPLVGTTLIPLTGDEQGVAIVGGKTVRYPLVSLRELILNVSTDSLNLGSVDNTRDLDKPISDLTQAALDDKSNRGHKHSIDDVFGLKDRLNINVVVASMNW